MAVMEVSRLHEPRWNQFWKKRMRQIRDDIRVTNRLSVVESYTDILEHSVFTYPKVRHLCAALQSFLNMWSDAIDALKTTRCRKKHQSCLATIVVIIKRPEFNLEFQHAKQQPAMSPVRVAALQTYLTKYKSLLYETICTLVQVDTENARASTNSKEEASETGMPKRFTCRMNDNTGSRLRAEILAIALFVLPGELQVATVDVIRGMVTEEAYQACRRTMRRTSSKSAHTSRMISRLFQATPPYNWDSEVLSFYAENPSLFLWGWVPIDVDEEIGKSVFCKWFDTQMHELLFLNYYVKAVSNHVTRVVEATNGPKAKILWQAIPGYRHLLRVFLPLVQYSFQWRSHHLKYLGGDPSTTQLPPQTYPICRTACQIVYSTSEDLLVDRKLFPLYMMAILENTNLHCSRSVGHALDRIRSWIIRMTSFTQHMAPTCKRIAFPVPTFQAEDQVFEYLCTALEKILKWCHYDTNRSGFEFIYNTADFFHPEQRLRLLQLVLSPEIFVSTFLHWSVELRQIFHYLLVYKIFLHPEITLYLKSHKPILEKIKQKHVVPGIKSTNCCTEGQVDKALASTLDKNLTLIYKAMNSTEKTIIPQHKRVYIKVALEHYQGLLLEYMFQVVNGSIAVPDPSLACQRFF